MSYAVHILDINSLHTLCSCATEPALRFSKMPTPRIRRMADASIDGSVLCKRCLLEGLRIDSAEPVPAGTTCKLFFQLERAFKVSMIKVPPSPARHFVIRGLTIDGASQFVSEGEIPCWIFRRNDVTLELDTCEPGKLFMLEVRNVSDKPRPFCAYLSEYG